MQLESLAEVPLETARQAGRFLLASFVNTRPDTLHALLLGVHEGARELGVELYLGLTCEALRREGLKLDEKHPLNEPRVFLSAPHDSGVFSCPAGQGSTI